MSTEFLNFKMIVLFVVCLRWTTLVVGLLRRYSIAIHCGNRMPSLAFCF